MRRNFAFAAAGVGVLAGVAYQQPAFAADNAPAVVAAADPKQKPTLSAAEIAALDPNKIDYIEHAPLFAMLRDRGIPVYINPRENERAVAPIRTPADLGSLVDGARDMPIESLDDIFEASGSHVTAASLGHFLDLITNVKIAPWIVSWRTVSRDGGKNFLPIFEKNSITPRPGMEADAKKILDEIAIQRTNVVEPILAGKVDAKTLERWAGQINVIVDVILPGVRGRETFRRAVINGYLGLDGAARQFAARGVDSLLGKSVDDPESGRKVYVPSGRSRLILSSAVELARLLGADKPGTEYISRVRIGREDVSLKMGDIGRGDGFDMIQTVTETPDEFWTQVRSIAAGEGAVALATERVAKNPDVQALMKSETPDTMRKWAPVVDQGIARQTNRTGAIIDAAKKATGADQSRPALVATNIGDVGVADAAAASLYWQRAERLMEQRGIDLNKIFGFNNDPLGGIGGNDGDGVLGMLRGKKPGT